MTREEARKAAAVMFAYAEGKEIEIKDRGDTEWISVSNPLFDWPDRQYRVQSKPEYRPYSNLKECFKDMKNHEPFGYLRRKQKGDLELVIGALEDEHEYIKLSSSGLWELKAVFEHYTYFDGQPFGILKND